MIYYIYAVIFGGSKIARNLKTIGINAFPIGFSTGKKIVDGY